jgi:hypothetical protein
LIAPLAIVFFSQLERDLMTKPDWNTRVSTTIAALQAAGMTSEDAATILSAAMRRFYRKVLIAYDYRPSSRLSSATQVTLVKASESSSQAESAGFDYGISNVFDGTIDVRVVSGSHETFVTSSKGAAEVASIISSV